MLKEIMIDKIKEILLKNYYKTDEFGCLFYEVYADYRDEFEEDTIRKIVDSNNPRETFENIFDENDFDYWEYQELIKLLERELEDDYFKHKDDITDWVNNNVYFIPPTSHFEKQEVLVNILVDTGDGNYDYTCNNFLNYYAPDVKELEIEKVSSVLWLMKQQGYNKRDLINLIKGKYDKGNKFLDSLRDELLNTTSSMNALVFSIKMSLGELIDYLETPKDIVLDKNSNCGLVDFWSGAGGLLNISLDKEVIIPKKYAKVSIDGGVGYSIRSIFGICSSYWKETFVAA